MGLGSFEDMRWIDSLAHDRRKKKESKVGAIKGCETKMFDVLPRAKAPSVPV